MSTECVRVADLEGFERAASDFARTLCPGDVVALSGDLGAGKTTFVAAAVRALHGPAAEVASPTFTFWHRYPGMPPIEHLDLYRIEDPAEAAELGLHEALSPRSIAFVEWPERLPELLPATAMRVSIAQVTEHGRDLRFRASVTVPERSPEPAPQRWLGLDGALGAFSAALVSNVPAEAPRTASGTGNDALERGLALIDEVLGGFALAGLAGIAVGTGPGSFTGLRIALSYAKSLGFAANLPLVGVSSYDAYEPPGAPAPCATFVHGRTGIACVRVRAANGTSEAICGTYDELAGALAELVLPGPLDSYGASEGVAPALGERGIIVRTALSPATIPALAIATRALRGAPPSVAHGLRADYGERAHYATRGERKGAGLGP